MTEMIHFIRQLEAYYRLEVIECSWKVLIDFLNKKQGDLDALIDAHRNYLHRTTKKILLWHSKLGKEVRRVPLFFFHYLTRFPGNASSSTDGFVHVHPSVPRGYGMSDILHESCSGKLMLFWKDNFYNYCLTESARRDQKMDEERVRLAVSSHFSRNLPYCRAFIPAIIKIKFQTRQMLLLVYSVA